MRYVIGIDEVGRGSLAGPVVVAAALLPRGKRIGKRGWGALKDSKKLSAKQRERWSAYFKEHPRVQYALARVYPRGIERMNISAAANLAAWRACMRLVTNNKLPMTRCRVFLDGGLYLGKRGESRANTARNSAKRVRINSRSLSRISASTVVRGDEKITSIKIASIIAKVSRDKFMKKMGKQYPHYGFEVHKGYGTKRHYAALKKYGPSEAHRRGWI